MEQGEAKVTFKEFSAVYMTVCELDCDYVTLGFVEELDWDADGAHGLTMMLKVWTAESGTEEGKRR